MDYTAPLDATLLVVEVASGTFAFKNQIKPANIRSLWDKLSKFIADTLKSQKGVLLPNLGSFRVGPVVGEMKKKIRPTFSLLEGRYGSVSQERPKYAVGGRPPVVQPSYSQLATAAGVHKGACQHLVAELLQRLGVHILSGRPIKLEFPGLGLLLTNRAGRIDFVFEPLLMEFYEQERHQIIPEMPDQLPDDSDDLVKGLQQVYLHNPPHLKSPSKSRPLSAASSHQPALRPGTAASPARSRPVSAASRIMAQAHAPYKGSLLDLWKLCKTLDKINSGCVPRLKLEGWLHAECRDLLAQVDAATVLELLSVYTYGKTAKHILYKPFMDKLDAAITRNAMLPKPPSPSQAVPATRLAQVQAWGQPADRRSVPATPAPAPAFPPHPSYPTQPATAPHVQFEDAGAQHTAVQPQPQQPVAQPAVDGGVGDNWLQRKQQQLDQGLGLGAWQQQQQAWEAQQAVVQQQQMETVQQNGYVHSNGPVQFAARSQQQPELTFAPPPLSIPEPPAAPEPQYALHYVQRQLSPRSRAEYDNFNRVHFDHIMQSRGPNFKRAVTPKVGEEPLTLLEYQAIRQHSALPTPSDIFARHPHSRPLTQHAQAQVQAGAAPDILHIMAGPPSPSQPSPPGRPQSAPRARAGSPTGVSVSQYDVMNEADPVLRQRKRAELAMQLQQGWEQQVREREHALQQSEQQHWPYAPTRQPTDKRPSSAFSRLPSPARPPRPPRRV